MDFGKVDNPGLIDFTLPADHPGTKEILKKQQQDTNLRVYVGCAKWNRQELKGFYPRGTKDELAYYSSQFNSIELNATFYRIPDAAQIKTWHDKTPEDFKFFPKVNQSISHFRRLNNVDQLTQEFCDRIIQFEGKLGMAFLQLHGNFGYKNLDRLRSFFEKFPKVIPLAAEVRHPEWFEDPKNADAYFDLLERNDVTNVLVDTAGRRDLLHMRLTTPTAFIRYVGANHTESKYKRLDAWVDRLERWVELGLQDIYFFVHQNVEMESPLLAGYLIQKLNERLGTDLKIPDISNGK